MADLYYFDNGDGNTKKDLTEAKVWLEKVLEYTSEKEADDAYLRVKSHQRLGIISYLDGDESLAKEQFKKSIESANEHLGGNWSFLLNHDPPNLWENLELEDKILDDIPKLIGNLTGFATTFERMKEMKPVDISKAGSGIDTPLIPKHILQLRNYTKQLRTYESRNKEWLLKLQLESLAKFPGNTIGAADYGVTFMDSYFRIFGHVTIQKLLKRKLMENRAADLGKIVVLGSALGSQCVWSSLVFGFPTIGFDMMESHITAAKELVETSIKIEEGGDAVVCSSNRDLIEFVEKDVISDIKLGLENSLVLKEISKSPLTWVNDYSWSSENQKLVEDEMFKVMESGSALVLYREARNSSWEVGGSAVIKTSWEPMLGMRIYVKP